MNDPSLNPPNVLPRDPILRGAEGRRHWDLEQLEQRRDRPSLAWGGGESLLGEDSAILGIQDHVPNHHQLATRSVVSDPTSSIMSEEASGSGDAIDEGIISGDGADQPELFQAPLETSVSGFYGEIHLNGPLPPRYASLPSCGQIGWIDRYDNRSRFVCQDQVRLRVL